MHNNLELAVSITKNIYNSIRGFDVFVKYLAFLFESNAKYKSLFEERGHKIASQAICIETKINLKELFPIELFIVKQNVSNNEFYGIAYEMMKPNLTRIMKKPDTNIHGLAILYRFGFGSNNAYYYKVYEDYVRILLKDYADGKV